MVRKCQILLDSPVLFCVKIVPIKSITRKALKTFIRKVSVECSVIGDVGGGQGRGYRWNEKMEEAIWDYSLRMSARSGGRSYKSKGEECETKENIFFFFNFVLLCFIYLFIYFWLYWVFVSVRGVSLVAASGGHSSSRCVGLPLSRPLLLRGTGSRRAGSVAVAHEPSCSGACGIFPDQGSNPCSLHWQADSQPLHYQGSPENNFFLWDFNWFMECMDIYCLLSRSTLCPGS